MPLIHLSSKTRRRLLWTTVMLLATGFLYIWSIFNGTHSVKILLTECLVAAGLILALLWFFFLSFIPGRIKLVGLGLLLGLAAFLGTFVEIRGVTGDVMPQFAWTWTPHADQRFAQENQVAEGAVTGFPASFKDYPRFLGSNVNSTVTYFQIDPNWETHPPQENWRIEVGPAWSGFSVVGHLAITQEQRGDREMVICYDLRSGASIWAHGDKGRFDTTVGGIGPRSTPTVAGDKVFTFGALGLLNCLDLTTGRLLWQKQTAQEHDAEKPRWGYSGSPLVIDATEDQEAMVIVSPGGANGHSLVAYRAEDGRPVWNGGSAPPSYSSPQEVTLAGTVMILVFNHGTIAGHHPQTGKLFWEVTWPGDNACVANPRVFGGDRLLVSAGYGRGAKMYRIEKDAKGFQANIVYESRRLNAKFANFVVRDGYVYGLDDGILTCMEASTGKRQWKKGRYGHGQVLLVRDMLLVQAEDGSLNLIKADPSAHVRLASMPVLDGKSWNTMALAGNKLLMRNDKEAVCLSLPGNTVEPL